MNDFSVIICNIRLRIVYHDFMFLLVGWVMVASLFKKFHLERIPIAGHYATICHDYEAIWQTIVYALPYYHTHIY